MATTMTRSHDDASRRVEKLSQASLRKIIDPDVDVLGEVGPGQVLPDELLVDPRASRVRRPQP